MLLQLVFCCSFCLSSASTQEVAPEAPGEILTPPPARSPAIHGPKIFGVRPGAPFLYAIPATGDRPMHFAALHLPGGLTLDQNSGQITGTLARVGEYRTTLRARNRLGHVERTFTIRVGDEIGLTPAMGWNSYNVWGTHINTERVLAAAQAMVSTGLSQHGFTYINIDDGWQGSRGGALNAVQPDPAAFPDMASMTARVHSLGLRVGIYHTPWVTSYGRRIGGSSENPQGNWDKSMINGPRNKKVLPYAIGKYHFTTEDAKQFAQWGFDYLKYDWAPVEAPETKEMYEALRASGRDIVLSLSNNASNTLLKTIADIAPYANSWRTNHDINDQWSTVVRNGFDQDRWAPWAKPGHFNDPDMLVVGVVGWGKPHPTRLTPDEQYAHISMWCLSAAPLILGDDLTRLDDFTRGLLTNDEVLDIDQDALGKQAVRLSQNGSSGKSDIEIYEKPLEDGSWAVGLFNLGSAGSAVMLNWKDLGLLGRYTVRDLWRQKNLTISSDTFSASVRPHGVVLLKLTSLTARHP
jgi:alpha-galactosidase